MHNNTVKRCRHSPHCYQFLKPETRRRHYAIANPVEILPSDYGSDDDPAESGSDDEILLSNNSSDNNSHGGSSHPSSEQESESDLDSKSLQVPYESDHSHFDIPQAGHLEFDKHEEASVQLEAELDDVIELLRDWYGPGLEKKFHDA
ncbi:hypothetical protein PAXRUDRAFT_800236 [Paxillus rubicundulus Ve08.2h10]|uniref:Uncharacterized protein n=1 Tax=Paxillus rubicundulus Ve08.2h10 TaxID=930991 RepID=A0A0D0DS43_9AGAM|nr:hypothetical protein PAXRUDRAFT_800236 [Paxillus rubicundulus Ve08.2h10]